jgi:membrane-bound lytic murein transglycosylase D
VTATRERIETIAARFKTTPAVIREANAIPPNMHPTMGSVVLVPKPASESGKDIGQDLADNATLAVAPDEPPRKKIKVRAGKRDTVNSIATRYKVTVAEVREWNDLKNDSLKPGQELKLQVRADKRGKSRVAVASAREDSPASKRQVSKRTRVEVADRRDARRVEPRHRKRYE